MRRRFTPVLLSSLFVLAPALAVAGPPLLCFPMVTSAAPSLPWGTGGWQSLDTNYKVARLAADTVGLLGPSVPTLARMETLRRAALYAAKDAAAADTLFAALRGRVSSKGATPADALARFDLGYAVEAFRQAQHTDRGVRAKMPAEDGYALVKQALAARGDDAAMEYAAALIAAGGEFRGAAAEHVRRAAAGAKPGSDLARTLEAHQPLLGERRTAGKS
jgi:hypothetical protein